VLRRRKLYNDKRTILNFGQNLNIVIIGATGGIGKAFVTLLCEQDNVKTIFCFSRSQLELYHSKIKTHYIDVVDEKSVVDAAASINGHAIDVIIVASGILSAEDMSPEKSLEEINFNQMSNVFAINTIGPALVAKHFLPLVARKKKSVFAVLSARVGSITDNHLGGWYSYRASKAALNMMIKTLSIEAGRRFKNASIIGLHPGTVDTELSKPFQRSVEPSKLFDAQYSAECLLNVINDVESNQTGQILAWDGQQIDY